MKHDRSTSSRCLHPICSALAERGKKLTSSEALRLPGVGRVTYRCLIRAGLIEGVTEEMQLRTEENHKQAKLEREKSWRLAAARRIRERRAKVKKMIVSTEKRLMELRSELERLNAKDQQPA